MPSGTSLMGIEHIHRSLRIGRHINRETFSNSRVRRAKEEGGREQLHPCFFTCNTFASAILQEADISQKMESREILYCLCLQLVCYLSHFNTILYQTSMGSGEPSSVSTYELKNSSSCLLLP
ncbi:hypothetical protein BDE02_02G053900 [Populus trichocarpa]|nr:hypothetical protein BDE02_02G053900 [Populus trichocarpa]